MRIQFNWHNCSSSPSPYSVLSLHIRQKHVISWFYPFIFFKNMLFLGLSHQWCVKGQRQPTKPQLMCCSWCLTHYTSLLHLHEISGFFFQPSWLLTSSSSWSHAKKIIKAVDQISLTLKQQIQTINNIAYKWREKIYPNTGH